MTSAAMSAPPVARPMSSELDDRFAGLFADGGTKGSCIATAGRVALAGLAAGAFAACGALAAGFGAGLADPWPAGCAGGSPAGGVGRFLFGSGWFGGTATAEVCSSAMRERAQAPSARA